MKGINKAACRKHLEPLIPPNSDCGLFLIQKLKYIVRTTVKMIDHRRLLVLCLYARGKSPGDRPVLTFTMFQASDTFITYDHRPGVKTVWRTSMLENLDGSYYFLRDECAFYSKPDEDNVIRFCTPYVEEVHRANGFFALDHMQNAIRGRETNIRQRKREQRIRNRMVQLRPLPKDTEDWLRRKIVPAYFFYGRKKGDKPVKGTCTACGQEVELTGVAHNAEGICPNCKRKLKMKSSGKCGYLWDRETASVVQRFGENGMVVRILKAYSSWQKGGNGKLDWYEESRIFVRLGEDGKLCTEPYFNSHVSVGITTWKKGYPPQRYLYGQNFNAETCGHLYCRNLTRELAGTPWQYCQLREFYGNDPDERMEVAPYLAAYCQHPRLEHLVKVGFIHLASDLVYRTQYTTMLDESQNRTHQILGVMAEDVTFLRDLDAGYEILSKFQEYCKLNLKDRQKLLLWQLHNDVEYDIPKVLKYVTPHKMMRYLDGQYPLMRSKKAQYGGERYRSMQDIVREYRDYLEMCAKEHYDLRNSFVLYPNDLQITHDKVARRIKQKEDAKTRRDFRIACRRIMSMLDFEMDGMKIVYPATPSDIVAEGHALHHCVGGYTERVAKQECIILFLRKCEEEAKPFYTVEVRNQKVVQVRGMRNEPATPEVEKFISQWEQKVLKCSNMLQAA